MEKSLTTWKNPALLLLSIGISSIGNFIYLVAINIIVYQQTGSAAAVAGLWIIGPLTNIITKFWTGSFIDYRSKRKIMIVTYILRATFDTITRKSYANLNSVALSSYLCFLISNLNTA